MAVRTEWFASGDTGIYVYPPHCVINETKADGSPLIISNGDSVIVIDVTARREQIVRLLRKAADKLEKESADV